MRARFAAFACSVLLGSTSVAKARKEETELQRDRKVVLWVLGGVVAVLAGLYAVGYFLTGEQLPRGTEVGGVAVGGMSAADAEQKLAEQIDLNAPITIRAEGRSFDLVPSRAGIDIDFAESVAQANPGRSWNPARMWDFVAGGSEYGVVTDLDGDLLTDAVAQIAKQLDQAPVQGAVRFTAGGAAEPVYPEPGKAVDTVELEGAILEAFPAKREFEVKLEAVQPEVTREEVARAMTEFANPALAGPVVLAVAGKEIEVPSTTFGPTLSVQTVEGRLEPQLDEAALIKAVDPELAAISVAPKDASVRIVKGKPKIEAAQNGVTYDPASITGAFLQAVVASGDQRRIEVATKAAAPGVTDADIAALGIKEVVSDFVTYYPSGSRYRDINQGTAAKTINGTILRPGETFSLNGILGERTIAKGYVSGGVIEGGVASHAVGGGISQVATTLFNAMFFAGLKDVEHKPHSYYISRYPVGREATVNWDNVDLKFTNDTQYGVLIEAWVVNSTGRQGEMHVRMWSTKQWDIKSRTSDRYAFVAPSTRRLSGPRCEPNSSTASGFQVDVYRQFYKVGSKKMEREEKFHTRYIPIDRVVCE